MQAFFLRVGVNSAAAELGASRFISALASCSDTSMPSGGTTIRLRRQ
jgi:hypothetical protein